MIMRCGRFCGHQGRLVDQQHQAAGQGAGQPRAIGCHYMPVYIVAAAVVDDADRALTPSRQPATTIAIEVVATGEAAGRHHDRRRLLLQEEILKKEKRDKETKTHRQHFLYFIAKICG